MRDERKVVENRREASVHVNSFSVKGKLKDKRGVRNKMRESSWS